MIELNKFWVFLFTFLWTLPFLLNNESAGTKTIYELADDKSYFVKIDGIDIHLNKKGEGSKKFILVHGFGSSTYTWEKVIDELSMYGEVISYDRPGFGLTERKFDYSKENYFSSEYQKDVIIKIMDYFNIEKAVIIGSSAGGNIALSTYYKYPERFEGIVLTDPVIYQKNIFSDIVKPFLYVPQFNYRGPKYIAENAEKIFFDIYEKSWYDKNLITENDFIEYQKATEVIDWEKGFYEFIKYLKYEDLTKKFDKIKIPVLVITGSDDLIVPTQDSIKLSENIKNSTLKIIDECGHLPQEEKPEEFLETVLSFVFQN